MVNWSKEHTVQDGWGRRAQNGDHAWRSYDIGIKLWFTDYFMSGTAAIIFSYSCIFFWNWCKKKSYELCLWKCWIGGGWFRLFPLILLRKKVYLKYWQYVSTAFVSCAWGRCRRNDGFFRSATCCAVPDPRSSQPPGAGTLLPEADWWGKLAKAMTLTLETWQPSHRELCVCVF